MYEGRKKRKVEVMTNKKSTIQGKEREKIRNNGKEVNENCKTEVRDKTEEHRKA